MMFLFQSGCVGHACTVRKIRAVSGSSRSCTTGVAGAATNGHDATPVELEHLLCKNIVKPMPEHADGSV